MAITTDVKEWINTCLRPANLQLQTLTSVNRERSRLEEIKASGHFSRPVFPVPRNFESLESKVVFDNLASHRARFETFGDAAANDVGYSFANEYFSSPDAEVLYTLVRHFRPRTIVEVGSGNSTRINRQAIRDGGLETKLISIDPSPRRDVAEICDEVFRECVESGRTGEHLLRLQKDDILFIDASHAVKTRNDVVYLFLNILPLLPAGVLVHVHDIFLPYDYPERWVKEFQWTEQYLVQAILAFGDAFSVLWPGHYLQRTRADFENYLPFSKGRPACSLWLRKISNELSHLSSHRR